MSALAPISAKLQMQRSDETCQTQTFQLTQLLTGKSILRHSFFWHHLLASANLSRMLEFTPITDRLMRSGDT